MNDTNERLIEDYLPIEAISAVASWEKSARKGHISTLHLWWARRPLVACRAALYGALVPASQFAPENGPRNERQSLGRADSHSDPHHAPQPYREGCYGITRSRYFDGGGNQSNANLSVRSGYSFFPMSLWMRSLREAMPVCFSSVSRRMSPRTPKSRSYVFSMFSTCVSPRFARNGPLSFRLRIPRIPGASFVISITSFLHDTPIYCISRGILRNMQRRGQANEWPQEDLALVSGTMNTVKIPRG